MTELSADTGMTTEQVHDQETPRLAPVVPMPRVPGLVYKTMGQWYDAGVALHQIVTRPRDLPQMAQFKLSRMRDALRETVEHVDRLKIHFIQELGAPAPEGNPHKWMLKEELRPEFERRMVAALEPVLGVKISRINVSELGNVARNGIEAREFELLGDLIVDDVPSI